MLKIKLFAVAVFLALAACAFLLSDNKLQAQTRKNSAASDELLQTVAGYKNWKEIRKPEQETDKPSLIINSTGMG